MLIGVIAHCCVMSERDYPEHDFEKKEFVDLNSPQRCRTTFLVCFCRKRDSDIQTMRKILLKSFGNVVHPIRGVDISQCLCSHRQQYDCENWVQVNLLDLHEMLCTESCLWFCFRSGENTPSVIVREPYETEVKEAPPTSAFRPYPGAADNGLGDEVNALKVLKDSPSRDRKFSSNYNTGNGNKVPTPSYPSDTAKKSVGYNSYAYTSDGDKMQVSQEQPQQQKPKTTAPYQQPANKFVVEEPKPVVQQPQQKPKSPAPYIQPAATYIPPPGPRKWGSNEKMMEGNNTPPRSPKSKKATGNASQGIVLEKSQSAPDRERYRLPALHMPNMIRRSRGRNKPGSNEPSSPTKVAKPIKVDLEEPDLEVKRTLIVPQKESGDPKWGSHNRKANDVSSAPTDKMSHMQGPKESTPKEAVNSSREGNSSREYSREFSDPQGHTSRRERDRQSRARHHGSRSRDREGRRDRSSSGHRRHRSRSGDRDPRGRTRDDVYSATSIDYVTGAPVRRSGRSKSQERADYGRYSSSGSRRSRSHDKGLNKSYDSDEPYHRRHHRDYRGQYHSNTVMWFLLYFQHTICTHSQYFRNATSPNFISQG